MSEEAAEAVPAAVHNMLWTWWLLDMEGARHWGLLRDERCCTVEAANRCTPGQAF